MAGSLATLRCCLGRHLTYNGLSTWVSIWATGITHYLKSHPDHWQDVVVGSIVGTALAYFCYRQYYPSLASEASHFPYGPRIKEEEILPVHTESHAAPYEPHAEYTDDDGVASFPSHSFELSGTVPRPSLGPMEEMWKSDGSGEPAVPEHSHHVDQRVNTR
jgi:hypothetical protein